MNQTWQSGSAKMGILPELRVMQIVNAHKHHPHRSSRGLMTKSLMPANLGIKLIGIVIALVVHDLGYFREELIRIVC